MGPSAEERQNTITAAVITGEHNFDVPGFQAAFRGMTDVDAYPQALENFVADQGGVRDEYDVLVFYNFHRPAPDARKQPRRYRIA